MINAYCDYSLANKMYAECVCQDLLLLAYPLPHPESSRLPALMLEGENGCVCVCVSNLQVDTMVMRYKQTNKKDRAFPLIM